MFLATRIFVTTLDDYWKCAVTGILSLRKNVTQGAIKSTHKTVWPVLTSMGKFGFGVKCNQPVICSSGYSVYEWNTNLYIEMESLNVGRKFCSSVYVPHNINNYGGVLIVACGRDDENNGLKSVEYLIMNNSFRSNKWCVCENNMPYKLSGHKMIIFQNKLILTGGHVGKRDKNICEQSGTN